MIRKKKYKIKKKSFGLLLLVMVLVALFGYFYYIGTDKYKLKKIGYSDSEIEIIENKLDNIDVIFDNEYLTYLILFLNDSNFNASNLKNYLDMYQDGRSVSDIIYLVNNNISYPYSDKLINIIHEEYFIFDNLDRYMSYSKEEDTNIIVRDVNSNLDYEFYSNIEPTDLSKDTLLIVNKYYNLEKDYYYGELVDMSLEYSVKSGQKLSSVAYEAFKTLVKAGEKDGVHVRNLSAYRSYATQLGLYNNYKSSNGLVWADKWSARAGHSEHQTGLALDVCSKGSWTFDKFQNSKEFTWMKENAYKYGFILRYPEGKTNITGYGYEPWHYRYVGVDAATYIYEHDITYEEYYAYFVK